MKYLVFIVFIAFCLVSVLFIAGTDPLELEPDSLFRKRVILNSPVLDPREAIRAMEVEEGFEVKLIASEPLLNSPVAIDFDNSGRIWALEMQAFMPNIEGEGEDVRTGKVVILEDRDGDGTADERKVFLDSLVLPRAIALFDGGVLVASPPSLYYYEIKNDKPGKRVLVDSAYANVRDVEHQPNGLYRAMDNWIYNAKSDKRYRKVGDEWVTEKTHFRGQWGIAGDDYGRLYYNNNSQNLLGDFYGPGLGSTNSNQQRVAGFNEIIVNDNRVYPIRPTPGVNRGYQDGVLDERLRLRNFTAAGGPVIYRGQLFGAEYNQNAFVAEPAGNLIKRNILDLEGEKPSGEAAYKGREFLASFDERFRPVSLYNGPDGALYIVDMYRGIIQHKIFITEYLKEQINKRSLVRPTDYGRIYKVVPKGSAYTPFIFPKNENGLVALLEHENGWIRDRAQQTLVDRKMGKAASLLRKNLQEANQATTILHSLWTLEGLGQLKANDVLALLPKASGQVLEHALMLAPAVWNASNIKDFTPHLKAVAARKEVRSSIALAYTLKNLASYDQELSSDILNQIANAFHDNVYVADAVISNLQGQEAEFHERILASNSGKNMEINKRLSQVVADIEKNKNNRDVNPLINKYPRGAALYKNTCQPCHGEDGNGTKLLAPPLNGSDWVTGDQDKLVAVVLYGLRGPIEVNGKSYDEIVGEMPGISQNKDLVDEDIAQLISFIRKNWSNNASELDRVDIIKVRNRFKNRQEAFTQAELDQW